MTSNRCAESKQDTRRALWITLYTWVSHNKHRFVNEHMDCCSGLSPWHRIEWLPKKWRQDPTTWPIRVAKWVVLRDLNWENYLLDMGLSCCHRNGDRTQPPCWYAMHSKWCWEIWAEWVTVRDESSSMLLLRWSWAKDILLPLSPRQSIIRKCKKKDKKE